jgi:ribosomal protein S18 acetylase RimI-like enzyme
MTPPAIRLKPMTAEQLSVFIEEDIPRYANANVQAGLWPESGALEHARASYERFLPQGVETPGQYLYMIDDSATGESVGTVWIGAHPGGIEHAGVVLSLYIDDAYRRQGYGRQAMLAIETEARQLRWTSLGLQVFGSNEPARKLYLALGYKVGSMNMTKTIGVPE